MALGRIVKEELTAQWTRTMDEPPIPTSITADRGALEILDPNDLACLRN